VNRPGLRAVAVIVTACFLATGCNTMYPRYMGIRPDSPAIIASTDIKTECNERHGSNEPKDRLLLNACEDYLVHVEWAQQLAESYRTRATMNEWSIFLAGFIALGALSAVAGLGVAAAASVTTIGLIGVSSGFASSVFALADNKTRAGFYTVAANEISSAMAEANNKAAGATKPESYTQATTALTDRVIKAANTLEDKRYEAAAAAAAAAKTVEANKKLQEFAELAEKAAVVGVDPAAGAASAEKDVELKTRGIEDLKKYESDMKVSADGDPLFSTVKENKLIVKMPARPDGRPRDVIVRLRLGPIPVLGQAVYKYQ
jgi:hypothetical protein